MSNNNRFCPKCGRTLSIGDPAEDELVCVVHGKLEKTVPLEHEAPQEMKKIIELTNEAIEFHRNRPEAERKKDESYRSEHIIEKPLTREKLEKWKDDPEKWDIPGIDGPGIKMDKGDLSPYQHS